MSVRRTTLAQLYEELRTIEVFDRLRDYANDESPTDSGYATRQSRRNQILAEIQRRLNTSQPRQRSLAQISGAFVFVCAISYAVLYYLLK